MRVGIGGAVMISLVTGTVVAGAATAVRMQPQTVQSHGALTSPMRSRRLQILMNGAGIGSVTQSVQDPLVG